MSERESVIERRRALLEELREHELVARVDFTRDGFETLIVHMEKQ